MRTKDGPKRATLLVAILLLTTCAGCASQSDWGTCAGIGALVGGLAGGAAGLVIADYTRGSHHEQAKDIYAYGYGAGGAVGGTILGAVIGHAMCDEDETQNRPVTYYQPSPGETYGNPAAVPPPPPNP